MDKHKGIASPQGQTDSSKEVTGRVRFSVRARAEAKGSADRFDGSNKIFHQTSEGFSNEGNAVKTTRAAIGEVRSKLALNSNLKSVTLGECSFR